MRTHRQPLSFVHRPNLVYGLRMETMHEDASSAVQPCSSQELCLLPLNGDDALINEREGKCTDESGEKGRL